jgi:hypothetical protein
MGVTFLTTEEARSWCQRSGIPLAAGTPDLSTLNLAKLDFSIPSDAGARVALSKVLYPGVWDKQSEVLIWTTGWSVWPSGEHLPLHTRFREALGERRTLEDVPAQVVDAASAKDGESIVVLNCLFLWDCWILSANGQYGVFLSHDEWGEAYLRSESTRSELLDGLTRMDLVDGP